MYVYAYFSILTCRQRKTMSLSPPLISLEHSSEDEEESSLILFLYSDNTSRLIPRNFTVGGREMEGICVKTHTALKKKKAGKSKQQ